MDPRRSAERAKARWHTGANTASVTTLFVRVSAKFSHQRELQEKPEGWEKATPEKNKDGALNACTH